MEGDQIVGRKLLPGVQQILCETYPPPERRRCGSRCGLGPSFKGKKRDVYRDNHNVHGTDLNLSIREAIEYIRTEHLIKQFTASGHMEDIQDLTNKYKKLGLDTIEIDHFICKMSLFIV